MAVALGVVGGQVAVLQGDGVLALNADAFGQAGYQGGVLHGDVRGGIDRGGTQAVGGIGAAVHDHGAAAPVCADCRGGPAGSGHGQVFSVGDAAAGGHDAAGAVARGGDGRAGNMQHGAVAGRAVHATVSAVDKDAVGAGGGGFNRAAGDGDVRAVLDQDCRVQAIEVAVVSAVGVAGLGDRHVRNGDAFAGADNQGTFIRGLGSIDFAGHVRRGGDFRRRGIGHVRGAASWRRSAAETAAAGGIAAAEAFRGLSGGVAAAETFRGLSGRITRRVAAVKTAGRRFGRRASRVFGEGAESGEQHHYRKDDGQYFFHHSHLRSYIIFRSGISSRQHLFY